MEIPSLSADTSAEYKNATCLNCSESTNSNNQGFGGAISSPHSAPFTAQEFCISVDRLGYRSSSTDFRLKAYKDIISCADSVLLASKLIEDIKEKSLKVLQLEDEVDLLRKEFNLLSESESESE